MPSRLLSSIYIILNTRIAHPTPSKSRWEALVCACTSCKSPKFLISLKDLPNRAHHLSSLLLYFLLCRGIGSIGTLLSHHLRLTNPTTPISLLLKSQVSADDFWLDKGRSRRGGELNVVPSPSSSLSPPAARGFDTELLDSPVSPILSLIATLKCPSILPAFKQLAPRLSSESTVVLLHNGMGIYEQLINQVFPNEFTRPRFILGTTTHGVRAGSERFEVVHHQPDASSPPPDLSFAVVPTSSASFPLPNTASLDTTLSLLASLTPSLHASIIPHSTLLPKLLLKLVLNSILNPLTALLSLPNGGLLSPLSHSPSPIANPLLAPLISQLATETSSVLRVSHPHLFPPPQSLLSTDPTPAPPPSAFTPEAIVTAALRLAHATASNRSSMLQDVDAGRETEVDWINGWVVETGRRVGVETRVNESVRGMVKAKRTE